MFDFLAGVILGKASEDYINKVKEDGVEKERNRDDYQHDNYERSRRDQEERYSERDM